MYRSVDPNEGKYVLFGTPVELPEEEEGNKKKVQVADQVATDKQGRRRFHGAFTGGFSAGYFNTVGTKEGWKPSEFKSSRKERNVITAPYQAPSGGRFAQRPEDFMDEEDFEENGIAPKQVRATGEFRDEAGSGKRRLLSGEDSRALEHLQSLVKPSSANVGKDLLKLMGWREGQGIGARIPARRRTVSEGVVLERKADERIFDDIAAAKGISFAPRDVTVKGFESKDNFHGIGYSGMSAKDFSIGTAKVKKSSGFGVGAFEEEDDDIYDAEDRNQYDRIMTKEEDVKLKPAFRGVESSQLSLEAGDDSFSGPSRFLLHGFKQAQAPLPRKIHPGHKPPRDFNPFHKFDKPGPLKAGLLSGPASRRFMSLSADDRSAILGEAPVRKPARKSPPPVQRSNQPLMSEAALDSVMQRAFKPFVTHPDPHKQSRYESFLKGHRVRARGMPEDEYQDELIEFQKAQRLFSRPMSKVIASKFQPASNPSGGPSSSMAQLADKQKQLESEIKAQSKTAKAKVKVFGPSTRKELEWHPSRVVCKRFNVVDPYPQSGIVGTVQDAKLALKKKTRWEEVGRVDVATLEYAGLAEAASSEKKRQTQTAVLHETSAQKEKFKDIKPQAERMLPLTSDKERERIEVEAEEEKARLSERPALDLFQAIFENSDSEEEEEEEEAEEEEKEKEGQSASRGPPAAPAAPKVKQMKGPTMPDSIKALLEASTSQFETEKSSRSAEPAQPLTLAFQHPLAAMGAPVVRASGSNVDVDVKTMAEDNEDDWVEVPAVTSSKKSKKKSKKSSKEKKKKKSKRHEADSDDDGPDDREILEKLRDIGGLEKIRRSRPKSKSGDRSRAESKSTSRPSASDYW